MGHHFRLITDQKSVFFMFDSRVSGKVKNEKILRWRLELSCYNYKIIYRPGKENYVADAFSHQCSAMNDVSLKRLPNGRETTVSTRHLVPTGELHEDSIEAGGDESLPATGDADNLQELPSETAIAPQPAIEPTPPVLRRSE